MAYSCMISADAPPRRNCSAMKRIGQSMWFGQLVGPGSARAGRNGSTPSPAQSAIQRVSRAVNQAGFHQTRPSSS
jgi:hypothetical protein